MSVPLLGSQGLLCLGALLTAASAHNGTALRGSLSGICTAHSQCGGQHWTGCTRCPGDQVCESNGKDPWTKVCMGPHTAELSSESEGDNCTAWSQCGGQNWTGCTKCPGDQVCDGEDPWTKVCIDPHTAELSNESEGDVCAAYSQCGGQNWTGCTECPGDQVCKSNGKDPWAKVCTDPGRLGTGSVCTTCAQCGGQQWTGCTECPGGQSCVLKDVTVDPWTMICVDDPFSLACYR